METYLDKNNYKRYSNLIHRKIAYERIYLKNREKYPLPFSKYVIHHKDGNKTNNEIGNLQIMTREEHENLHKKEYNKKKGIKKTFGQVIRDLIG